MAEVKKLSVIIAGAGNSTRLGIEYSKQFVMLLGKPLLCYSIEKFLHLKNVFEIIVVTNDIDQTQKVLTPYKSVKNVEIKTVLGGELRQESVYRGFSSLSASCNLVLIHDVARPLFDLDDVKKCIEEAALCGSAVLAVPVSDTIKKAEYNEDKLIVKNTLDRNGLYLIQTPQVYSYDLLAWMYEEYKKLKDKQKIATDEACVLEGLGKSINLVIGKRKNIKITYKEDLEIAVGILGEEEKMKEGLCLKQ